MKKFIIAMMFLTFSHAAQAGYAERVCSEPPHKEVFRIGVKSEDRTPLANDCEVIYKGDDAAIKTCNYKRCVLSTQAGGGH